MLKPVIRLLVEILKTPGGREKLMAALDKELDKLEQPHVITSEKELVSKIRAAKKEKSAKIMGNFATKVSSLCRKKR